MRTSADRVPSFYGDKIGLRDIGLVPERTRRNEQLHEHWTSLLAARRSALGTVIVIAVVIGASIGAASSQNRPLADQRCQGSDAAAFHCRNTWIAVLRTSFR